MSDNFQANNQQNTPSYSDLETRIAADEAARNADEDTSKVAETSEEEAKEESNTEESNVREEPTAEEAEENRKRIARLAFEARQAKQQARAYAEELARARGQAPQQTYDEQVQRQIHERAAALAAQAAFDQRANEVYQQGKTEFPDFDDTLANFRNAGLPLSTPLIEAALEVGDAHRLIRYLGQNIDEAERIQNLPPHRMGAALAKLQQKASPARVQSKAPPPIRPLAGKGRTELPDDKMDLAEYMRREDEKERTRRSRWG